MKRRKHHIGPQASDRSIAVFLSLVVCVLSASANDKVASKPNFAMAINQYFQAHPACIEIPATDRYKFPVTVVPTHHRYYNDEPKMFAFLAHLAAIPGGA